MDHKKLSFDGKGINDVDEYRTRIATFSSPEMAGKYGNLFAAVTLTKEQEDEERRDRGIIIARILRLKIIQKGKNAGKIMTTKGAKSPENLVSHLGFLLTEDVWKLDILF